MKPNTQFSLQSYRSSANSTRELYEVTGRKLESRPIGEGNEGQELIDTRKLPSGMYFFQISQDGKKVSEGKFVVTH